MRGLKFFTLSIVLAGISQLSVTGDNDSFGGTPHTIIKREDTTSTFISSPRNYGDFPSPLKKEDVVVKENVTVDVGVQVSEAFNFEDTYQFQKFMKKPESKKQAQKELELAQSQLDDCRGSKLEKSAQVEVEWALRRVRGFEHKERLELLEKYENVIYFGCAAFISSCTFAANALFAS